MMELLVVMVVAAMLLALGVPSYRYVTYSNRVSGEVNALLGDLQFARSEAIKQGLTVTVCASANGTTCSGTASWQTGWIIFVDINNNQTPASSANILRVSAAFVGSASTQDTFAGSNSLNFVSFNREGFAASFPSGAATTGYATITLHTTPLNTQWTRCVQVFTSGMMGTERTNDAQGNCS